MLFHKAWKHLAYAFTEQATIRRSKLKPNKKSLLRSFLAAESMAAMFVCSCLFHDVKTGKQELEGGGSKSPKMSAADEGRWKI